MRLYEAVTIAMFKKLLERCMDSTGFEGYGPNAGRWDSCRWDMLVVVG